MLRIYRERLELIDRAFAAAQMQMPDFIPCHDGCSPCCSAFFAVRFVDCALMGEGILRAPESTRIDIIHRCQVIVSTIKTEFKDLAFPFRIDHIGWPEFERFIDRMGMTCPVLSDSGSCRIHRYRPRICRLAGTIFRDPETGTELDDFCFIAAERRRVPGFHPPAFPLDESLIEAQEMDAAFRNAYPIPIGSGFTIPAAGILEYLDCI